MKSMWFEKRNLLIVVALFAAVLHGCKGEQGPAGPAGPQGPAGVVKPHDDDDHDDRDDDRDRDDRDGDRDRDKEHRDRDREREKHKDRGRRSQTAVSPSKCQDVELDQKATSSSESTLRKLDEIERLLKEFFFLRDIKEAV